jgi:hypothetical protein
MGANGLFIQKVLMLIAFSSWFHCGAPSIEKVICASCFATSYVLH